MSEKKEIPSCLKFRFMKMPERECILDATRIEELTMEQLLMLRREVDTAVSRKLVILENKKKSEKK